MIAMRVGDEDMRDLLALYRTEHGVDMRAIVGAGIENGDFACTYDVGAGAGEGERAGIGRQDPAHMCRDAVHPARRRVEVAIEGDVVGHGTDCVSFVSDRSSNYISEG